MSKAARKELISAHTFIGSTGYPEWQSTHHIALDGGQVLDVVVEPMSKGKGRGERWIGWRGHVHVNGIQRDRPVPDFTVEFRDLLSRMAAAEETATRWARRREARELVPRFLEAAEKVAAATGHDHIRSAARLLSRRGAARPETLGLLLEYAADPSTYPEFEVALSEIVAGGQYGG